MTTISLFGDFIANSFMTSPHHLSVTANGVIYLADLESGVHQSTDNGVTWNHLFALPDNRKCLQAIKVSRDFNGNDDWWILEDKSVAFGLRVYTLNTAGNLSWRDVILSDKVTISSNSRLAYDGFANIILLEIRSENLFPSNSEIHVISATTGHYARRLLSLSDLAMRFSTSLAVDNRCDSGRVMLYVGLIMGFVDEPLHALSVFEVIYEE